MKWGNGCETGKILDLRGRFLLGEQKYEKDWQEVVTMKQGKKLSVLFLVLGLLMLLSITACAAAADSGFRDVAADVWYSDSVAYVKDNGFMGGTEENLFSPDATMNRGMFATVLYRMAGSPAVTGTADFSDVSADAYYANAVLWATENKMISGYGNNLFGAADPVSREQIAAILWRYAGRPAAEQGIDFADERDISSYAVGAVDWARANGIVNGKNGNVFDPQGNATRAEVAAILRNYMLRDSSEPVAVPDTPSGESKTLVVYFSMPETTSADNMTTEEDNSVVVIDGEVLVNTQYMANVIRKAADADIFRIEPETPYPTEHSVLVSLAADEQDANARPAIKGRIADFDSYDTIYIGYPIWWSDMPMILYTFFDTYDFSGKTIIPFSTHGGSSFAGTPNTIKTLEPNATILDGLTISRDRIQDAEQEITDWVRGLNK